MIQFKINKEFVDSYRKKKNPFKNALAEATFYRTYSRIKEDGTKEDWVDCLERVVNGVYTFQKIHCNQLKLHWDNSKAQRSCQKMFDKMFNMKFLPPGRGLFMMAPDGFVMETDDSTPLYNCAFVSTKEIKDEGTLPFTFGMNSLFLGVGLGFNTKGAGKIKIKEPIGEFEFEIEDCRESWTDSLDLLLQAFFYGKRMPSFNYEKIRPAGIVLKRFGGVSSGPGPLKELHEDVINLLTNRIGGFIKSTDIVDIFNMIGRCIVSGSVRRSAELALGEEDDEEFLEMKDWTKFPEQVEKWRWASNNSIYGTVGKTDYKKILGKTGEVPGIMWLQNAKEYGRMEDGKDYGDMEVEGGNPCNEIPLASYEFCNLSECFPAYHDTFEEFKETLKFAYLYCKTITLLPTGSMRTNEVQFRNRRLGISCSGILEAFTKNGTREMIRWFDEGYKYLQELDKMYSGWFKVGTSVRLTTVKPSGTISIVAGTGSPGVHAPHSEYYLRRVRIGVFDPILGRLDDAGYKIEDEIYGGEESKKLQKVVSFPIKEEHFEQSKKDLTMWQQLKLVSLMQRYWSSNAVSVTVTYKPEEEKDIPRALEYFERDLKTVSFLPLTEHGFELAPYEEITKEQYEEATKNLKIVNFNNLANPNDAIGTKYCDAEGCLI